MKMVKSLLLGSAAGLVAVAGAQAADLPVKAKPVEYVKVCSLYGAGYYYLPGTDICVKIGGYVRTQWSVGTHHSTHGAWQGTNGRFTRTDSDSWAWRSRGIITMDTRQQTAYGTLRTYFVVGANQDNNVAPATLAVYSNRAFVQFAGFTLGKATSFFDGPAAPASFGYQVGQVHAGDTGETGWYVAAYTAQFGNGVSATISIEDNRRSAAGIFNANRAAGGYAVIPLAVGSGHNNNLGPNNGAFPDIVANLRVDQAWGTALISGVLHDASGGYYGNGNEGNGHPSNRIGWAIGAGAVFNLPMIARGNRFSFNAVYSQGATAYASPTPGGQGYFGRDGAFAIGTGVFTDGVYGVLPGNRQTSVQLTTAWSLFAGYEHFWTPAVRTSIYGSYINVSHNGTAKNLICNNLGFGAGDVCNPDFQHWNIATRTQWEPVRGLTMGLDIMYSRLRSAQYNTPGGLALNPGGAAGAVAAGGRTTDLSSWTGQFRLQRSILP